MKPLDLKNVNIEKIDIKKEYSKASKDPIFNKITSKLKMSDDVLCNYTSMLETSCQEYHNCMECTALATCQNRIKGHVFMPNNIEGNLVFEYRGCKYFDKMRKNSKYLEKITYFNIPKALQEASISKIHKTDKKRFEAILWVNNFYNNYKEGKTSKGLYLHGNFGCGKSYIITALLNDLAHDGYKSAAIFWPEFVRKTFDDDFQSMYEEIKNIPLLLIDDIGAEYNTPWGRDEVLCPLLQHRMDENLPTFFTSNLNLEQLEEHLANSKSGIDSLKAARIIARIKQLSEPLEMISKNLRN